MGTTGVGKDKLLTLIVKWMGYVKYGYRTAALKDVFGDFTEPICGKLFYSLMKLKVK